MPNILVPPLIGMTDLTVAAADASAYARARAQIRCDGTDDQDSINEALDAGGHIRLTPGTFHLGDSVILPTKCRLSGAGQATVLRADADFAETATGHATIIAPLGSALNFKCIVVTDPSSATESVSVSDLCIDGNSANQTSQGQNVCGLMFLRSTNGTASRVTAKDVNRAGFSTSNTTRQFCLCTTESEYIDFYSCNAERAGYAAFAIRDASHYITVHGGRSIIADSAIHAMHISGTGNGASSYLFVSGHTFIADGTPTSGFFNYGQSNVNLQGCTFYDAALYLRFGANLVSVRNCDWRVTSETSIVLPVTIDTGSFNVVVSGCSVCGSSNLITLNGVENVVFANNKQLRETGTGGYGGRCFDITNCKNVLIDGNPVASGNSSVFRLNGTNENVSIVNNRLLTDSTNSYGVYYSGTTTNLRIIGNDLTTITVPTNRLYGVPQTAVVRENIGVISDTVGVATVASGQTYVDVTHGLFYGTMLTAENINITPTTLGNAASWWVSAIGATTFRINVNADPGVGTAVFSWRAKSHTG